MSDAVCAVVVTYNRKDLLRICLRSLLQQTRPIDHILVNGVVTRRDGAAVALDSGPGQVLRTFG